MNKIAVLAFAGCLIISLNSSAFEIQEPSYLNYRFENKSDFASSHIDRINQLTPSANGTSRFYEPGYLNFNYEVSGEVNGVKTFDEIRFTPTYN